ncbi:MAG: putative baseplate assembly protein [Sphingorhabdus sp.]
MPIRPPALDDRSFEDLYADMLRRVPAHTPEWTDVREGDPGEALLRLFAYLGDTILYRANLIPERQRLAFLRLLGQPLRRAMPAHGLLQARIDDEVFSNIITLPQHSPISKPVHFELDSELSILPVEGKAYIKRRPDRRENEQMSALIGDLQQLYGIAGAGSAYVTTPVFESGAAEAEGRDFVRDSIDECLWFALLAPSPEAGIVAAVKDTLGGGAENRRAAMSVGIAPLIDIPEKLEPVTSPSPIAHVWEICTGAGDGDEYLPLEMLADGTSGLTRQGVQKLLLPGKDDFGVPGNDVLANIQAGVGNRPPRIDDPIEAARLVGWVRLRPLPEAKLSSLKLGWAGINAATATQLKTLGRQQIGRGTGASGQQLDLGATQVEAASLILEVEEEEGMRQWRQVPDLAHAARADRVYSIDAEAGQISFGDGLRGTAPALGRAIHVAYMRSGGGAEGNLPAGSLKSISGPTPTPRLKLGQPLAMAGGIESETLELAEARIPALLRHGDRAVTRSDYSALAMATPGTAVGRVEILERFKPQQRRSDLPGVLSVMAIPARAGTEKPAPRPDRAMLESIHGWLDARRPLGTELYVIGPDYVPMGVSAAVELVDPDSREAVLDMVRQAIRLHLWPLQPGGPDGQGWPLGRAVDDRLIETAIARVPGVRSIAPVRLFTRHRRGRWVPIREDRTGRGQIRLRSWQLPELSMLSVAVGENASTRLPPDGGEIDDNAVAIPVVPELC